MSVKKVITVLPTSATLVEQDGEMNRSFLRLPHPRTRQPSLFLPYSPTPSTSSCGILEVQKIQPPVDAQRCWFLTLPNPSSPSSTEEILSDGTLTVLTPFDPLFLLISLLSPLQPRFVEMDDCWEEAAGLAVKGEKGEDGEEEDEDELKGDVVKFGNLDCVRKRMEDICETKEHESTTLYRFSPSLALAQLQLKLTSLVDPNSPNSLFGPYESTELGSGKRKREDEDVTVAEGEIEFPTVTRALGKEGLGDGKGLNVDLQRETREKMVLGILTNYLLPSIEVELLKLYSFPNLTSHLALATSTSSVLSSTYLPGRGGGGGGAGNAAAVAKKRKLEQKGSRGVELLKKVNVKGMKTLGEMFKMAPKKKEELTKEGDA